MNFFETGKKGISVAREKIRALACRHFFYPSYTRRNKGPKKMANTHGNGRSLESWIWDAAIETDDALRKIFKQLGFGA